MITKTKTRDPQELPARAKKKSKKVQKQERKRERRRARLHRACKDDKVAEPQMPQSSTPTPMPSPGDLSLDGAAHDEILITDQSLSELLASTNHTGDILSHNGKDLDTDSSLQSNDCSDRIVRLEANLVAVNLDFQCKHDECVALQNQIDLLNEEMDCYKKTDKNQKNEIKRLTNENDRLVKELSKHSGFRRYFDKSPSEPSKLQDHDLSVKYDKLRSKLTEITDSLVTALEDGFSLVSKKKTPTLQPCDTVDKSYSSVLRNKCNSDNTGDASVPPPTRTHGSGNVRAIPVVEIGAAARDAARRGNLESPPVARPDSSPRQAQPFRGAASEHNHSSETLIIGTSLVQGLGPRLQKMGIDATAFMYRGADIPTIQSRVQHIISPGMNPKCIVIQVGGNDATKQPANSIISRYESLIRNIRHRCPDAKIVLSKVPPRRGNARTVSNISEINVGIDNFANTMKNVCSVSVCPTSVLHFKKDCTHFNTSGMDLYARNLSAQLRNFLQLRATEVI